jgi:Glucosidase II beta subunit-like
MKLRQRRGVIGSSGPILPLANNGDVKRRRRRPMQVGVSMKRSACCLVVSLSSIILIIYFVLASFPESHSNNRISRVLPKRTRKEIHNSITCADGLIGFVDDDYCDCEDGRDEPSTSACSNVLVQQKSFHCKDGVTIYASRVNDGVLDCPDRTDEMNPRR